MTNDYKAVWGIIAPRPWSGAVALQRDGGSIGKEKRLERTGTCRRAAGAAGHARGRAPLAGIRVYGRAYATYLAPSLLLTATTMYCLPFTE
jgi:hypothetical protein